MYSNGGSMLIPCGMDAFHPHSMWTGCIPCGIHVDIPCGLHVDIPPFHVEFGYSMTIPYGIHVESMWNGGPRMSGISAKMYSIWNGGSHVESMWNPCGMRSIPCGVHVESMWNVGGE